MADSSPALLGQVIGNEMLIIIESGQLRRWRK